MPALIYNNAGIVNRVNSRTAISTLLKRCFGSVDTERMSSVKTRSCARFSALPGFLLTFLFSVPALALSFTDFSVDATASWVDTGILINIGDQIDMTATGSASGGSVPNGPAGDGGPCVTCIAPVPASHYALVGRIGPGPGTEFLVGASYSGMAADAGTLYLAFNDDNHADNSGSFLVSGTVIPEPTTPPYRLRFLRDIWTCRTAEARLQ